MPAHSGEIIDEIARRLISMRRAQLFGIDLVIGVPGSSGKNMLRDGRVRGAHSKATHTDPQILFPVAS